MKVVQGLPWLVKRLSQWLIDMFCQKVWPGRPIAQHPDVTHTLFKPVYHVLNHIKRKIVLNSLSWKHWNNALKIFFWCQTRQSKDVKLEKHKPVGIFWAKPNILKAEKCSLCTCLQSNVVSESENAHFHARTAASPHSAPACLLDLPNNNKVSLLSAWEKVEPTG